MTKSSQSYFRHLKWMRILKRPLFVNTVHFQLVVYWPRISAKLLDERAKEKRELSAPGRCKGKALPRPSVPKSAPIAQREQGFQEIRLPPPSEKTSGRKGFSHGSGSHCRSLSILKIFTHFVEITSARSDVPPTPTPPRCPQGLPPGPFPPPEPQSPFFFFVL